MKKRISARKKKVEKGFSFSEQYRLSWKFISQSRNFIYFSIFIFFLLSIVGFVYPKFFVNQILDIIENLKLQTEGLNTIQLIWFILLNNLKAAFLALILGIFFGIVPFVNAVFNGYILGFVSNYVVADSGIGVLWKLLPHGIFELPALFISIGLGLKLGMYLFIKEKKDSFSDWILNSLRVFVFVIFPLLIIAAIIEGALISILG